MKQSLQLRLGQQLTMTPQLQQAIRLLQLSSLELKHEIQEALESNIMLELAEEERTPQESHQEETGSTAVAEDRPLSVNSDDIPNELPLDTNWEDVFDTAYASATAEESNNDYLYQRSAPEGLQEYLEWQAELSHFSERDQLIATAIIDSINEQGYLDTSIEEIHANLADQLEDLELDEVVAVLHRIQQFDPPGVAARSLGECMGIQLRQLPEDIPWRKEALQIVNHHLNDLATQNITALKKKMALEEQALEHVMELIRTLQPYPGEAFADDNTEYVIPDVFVRKHQGKWTVSINPELAPRLRINPYYSNMIKRSDKSEDNQSMRHHLQEARWFLRSLQSRSETLVRVAQCIVEKQQEFFEHGDIAMKPLILRDVAEELGLHESTVSRVTTNKYMHTPRGIYEFKFFFSSHVSTQAGGECSATAIKALIKELIDHENPAKPLSDLKIANLLQEKGINVARRTVAKYREAMNIPSSSRRKRLL